MKLRFRHTSILFLILVFLQAIHSLEEYYGRLWENFPPATFLTGLFSENLETGFLIINIGIFVIGILLWAFVVDPDRRAAKYVMGFWIAIELINGIGHPFWAIWQGKYEPGVITAPFLFVVALMLVYRLNWARAH